jgi:hypothetical protein
MDSAAQEIEKISEKKTEQPRSEQFPKWLQDLLSNVAQNSELAGLVASLGAIAAGSAMLLDDAKDFGKDGSERSPAMPHHWLVGALTLIGGVAGACTAGLALLKKVGPPPRRVEVPESFLRQAIPVDEALEKLNREK